MTNIAPKTKRVDVPHRVIAKVSRSEVADRFLRPAPEAMVRALVETGAVTAEQAELARRVPMADDITAEADSGGHAPCSPARYVADVAAQLMRGASFASRVTQLRFAGVRLPAACSNYVPSLPTGGVDAHR